ncbi:MAG: hypothetical protein ACLP0J_13755 [Solirubrobacteraceae bacterium]
MDRLSAELADTLEAMTRDAVLPDTAALSGAQERAAAWTRTNPRSEADIRLAFRCQATAAATLTIAHDARLGSGIKQSAARPTGRGADREGRSLEARRRDIRLRLRARAVTALPHDSAPAGAAARDALAHSAAAVEQFCNQAGHQKLETTRRYTLPSAADRQRAVEGPADRLLTTAPPERERRLFGCS